MSKRKMRSKLAVKIILIFKINQIKIIMEFYITIQKINLKMTLLITVHSLKNHIKIPIIATVITANLHHLKKTIFYLHLFYRKTEVEKMKSKKMISSLIQKNNLKRNCLKKIVSFKKESIVLVCNAKNTILKK